MKIEKLKNIKIKKEWEIAFFATLLIGIIAHMYVLTNWFPNHDGLYNIYSTQNCSNLGRWFLQIACLPSSYFTLPGVIGMMSIIYISITSVIIVELFNIKNKINIVFISAVLVLFPTVASNFAYVYTMDGYMLALLLSALSVLLTYKYKYGFGIGAILLCFSIGIYQAYMSFAIILCIIKILISLIQKDKNYLKEVAKDFLLIFLGFLLYYLILKIVIKTQNILLADYQGVNQLTSFSLSNVFSGIIQAYKSFVAFPVKSNVFSNNILVMFSNIIMLFALLGIYLKNYINQKCYKDLKSNLILVLIIIGLPICFNIITILSPSTYYHMLMRYTWCLPYIALIILIEHFSNKQFKLIYIICMIFILFDFYIISNIAYFNMEQKFEKTYSFALRLVDRIEQCEEYNYGMPVAVIGTLPKDTYPSTDLTYDITKGITGAEGDIIFFDPYHYESFFKNYMHFSIEFASQEEINKILASEQYSQMPNWPKKDSVKVIDNILVVNLSKTDLQ